jgi:hypothetical protein
VLAFEQATLRDDGWVALGRSRGLFGGTVTSDSGTSFWLVLNMNKGSCGFA